MYCKNINSELFKEFMVGKKVCVLGLGISNLPALEFLDKCGSYVIACDRTPPDKFDKAVLKKIKRFSGKQYLGDDYLDHLDGCDYIIKSPGINPSLAQIENAKKNGSIITSEMEIFMSLCPCKIIGVTGSDGKTTTTTLIYEMLKREKYTCHLGGNIGMPLIGKLDKIKKKDIAVLELSSFQLMNMHVSPEVAVITNISPNHLDYHTDMTEYVEAKSQIFKHQNEEGRLIVNLDNAITAAFAKERSEKTEFFSRRQKTEGAYIEDGYLCYNGEKIVHAEDIKIPGWHNVENYLAAIAAVRPYVTAKTIRHVAKTFCGVEHRMEFVRNFDGIDFYNDSIGSSPTRTIAGIEGHDGKIVLIAGGYDKNLNYDELGITIKNRVSSLVLIGDTSSKIEASVKKAFGDEKCPFPIVQKNDYSSAVEAAYVLARSLRKENDKVSVILSPASASFDMFKNFMERGNVYKELVNNIKKNNRDV